MENSGYIVEVTTGFIALPLVMGLILAILIQPRRTYINWLFALFAGAVGFWLGTSFIESVDGLHFTTKENHFYLQGMGMGFTNLAFFVFVVGFTERKEKYIRLLVYLAFILAFITFFGIWNGYMLDWNDGDWELKTPTYLVMGLVICYLLLAYYLLHQTKSEKSDVLKMPAIFLISGMIGNYMPYLQRIPFDTLMATLSVVAVGRQVLQFQVFNPLEETNRELACTVKQLREAYVALEAEKSKVEALNRHLHQASEHKSAFLANMSHELRTPLNSIVGYSELLTRGIYGEVNTKQIDRIEKITRNGTSLLALINSILDLSKIEAGKLDVKFEPLKLSSQVELVLAVIEPLADKKHLPILADIVPEPIEIYGDEMRIRQILLNLMNNAVKFTHQGHVKLTIRNLEIQNGSVKPMMGQNGREEEEIVDLKLPMHGWLMDGRWSLAMISDTGIGISTEHQSRVFNEFEQADSSSTREYEGTGLGLAIVRRLMELHHGRIWLASSPGEGSTFYAAFPARMLSDEYGFFDVDDSLRHSRHRIALMIDDDSHSADDLAQDLKQTALAHQFHYNIIRNQGKRIAMPQIRLVEPDLIMLNLMLPNINSWELLALIKTDRATCDIPVIVTYEGLLEPEQQLEWEQRAQILGAFAVLKKPIHKPLFETVIANILINHDTVDSHDSGKFERISRDSIIETETGVFRGLRAQQLEIPEEVLQEQMQQKPQEQK